MLSKSQQRLHPATSPSPRPIFPLLEDVPISAIYFKSFRSVHDWMARNWLRKKGY